MNNFYSKESSTKNGEGVEVLKNEPFDDNNGKGQYTKKIYHLGSSLPNFVSMIIPVKVLDVVEVSTSNIRLIFYRMHGVHIHSAKQRLPFHSLEIVLV
jgi:hypothetical protein